MRPASVSWKTARPALKDASAFNIVFDGTAPRFVGALIGRLREAAPDKSIVVYPNSGETYHASDNSWSGEACDLDADQRLSVSDAIILLRYLFSEESVTIPETIDAIRASMEMQATGAEAVAATDGYLGIA